MTYSTNNVDERQRKERIAELTRIRQEIDGELAALHGVDAETADCMDRRMLERLLETAPIGIAVVRGPEHRYTFVNPAYQGISGTVKTPMIGRSLAEVFPDLLAKGVIASMDAIYDTGQPVAFRAFEANVGPGRERTFWDVDEVPVMNAAGRVDSVLILTREVTEHKRAEVALRESEERYRNLFAVIPSGVAVYEVINDGNDLEGKDFIFTDMNPAGEKIDRVHRAEIIGKSLYECFPNVREMGLVEVFTRVWQTGEPEFFPVTLYTDHKISLWVTDHVWRLPTGELVALFNDITELKRTEQVLRDSERSERERATELATLLDAVPMPVFIAHDPDCLHLAGNRAADELLRHPHGAETSLSAPAALRPRHFTAVKDGRELSLDELPAQRAARGEHMQDFEFSLVFDDRTVRYVLGYGTPLLDEQGCPRGAVHVLVDITQRKRAEEALRESEERYHRLFDSLTEGFLLAELMRDDAGKPVDFRIIEANLAYESVLGCKRAEAIGRTLFELFPRLAYDRFEAIACVAQTGKPLRWQGFFEPTGRYYECFYYSPRPDQTRGNLYGHHRTQTGGGTIAPTC